MDTETKATIRLALVELVLAQVKVHLPVDTNIEEYAQDVIEVVAHECSDDRGMDLAEETQAGMEWGEGSVSEQYRHFCTFLKAFRNSLGKLPRADREELIAALDGFQPDASELKEIYETLCDTLCE